MLTTSKSSANSASANPLTKRDKLIYGTGGGITNFSLTAPNYLANPIFNLALHINPVLIGVVIACSRVWDGVTEPLFGYLSDNTRTRWGRRKPYLFVGGILLGVTFALMWWLPRNTSQNHYFWWFLITSLLFYTASSMFLTPWTALGIEMANDYNERTTLNAYAGAWSEAFGVTCGWLFPLTQLAVFQDTLEGVRYVGLFFGSVLILLALLPALLLKEKPLAAPAVQHKREPFLASMKAVCSNRTFLQVTAVSVLTMTTQVAVGGISLYINIYHVYGGDKLAAARMQGLFGTSFSVLWLLSVPLVTWVAHRVGKHRTLMICLGVVSLSHLLKFFAYSPVVPWAQLLIPVLMAPGLLAYNILLGAMTADLVDYDEFCTGRRREALLASANHWITKMGISTCYIATGLILTLTGFDAAKLTQNTTTVFWMRICFCGIPAIGALLALFVLRGYPLTKERIQEIQAELVQRRAVSADPKSTVPQDGLAKADPFPEVTGA
jgi:GPH family glycoside/pentoside/hexuronide:cation symporter